MDTYITGSETAKILGISYATLKRWKKDRIPGIYCNGSSHAVYLLEDIKTYAASYRKLSSEAVIIYHDPTTLDQAMKFSQAHAISKGTFHQVAPTAILYHQQFHPEIISLIQRGVAKCIIFTESNIFHTLLEKELFHLVSDLQSITVIYISST